MFYGDVEGTGHQKERDLVVFQAQAHYNPSYKYI